MADELAGLEARYRDAAERAVAAPNPANLNAAANAAACLALHTMLAREGLSQMAYEEGEVVRADDPPGLIRVEIYPSVSQIKGPLGLGSLMESSEGLSGAAENSTTDDFASVVCAALLGEVSTYLIAEVSDGPAPTITIQCSAKSPPGGAAQGDPSMTCTLKRPLDGFLAAFRDE